ncbi:unnamed protein product, partial [Pylaiella littoralis]
KSGVSEKLARQTIARILGGEFDCQSMPLTSGQTGTQDSSIDCWGM